jgi:pimeloyl-ACP methyl ester carboxylesterase
MPIPDTSYAMAGDAAVAYHVYGSGEHRVVWVPPAYSNVELFWEWAPLHRYFERWGSFATVAAFDQRGTGSSDRIQGAASVEERMEDIGVVMDAVGWERATIFGHGDSGPLACLFAATYPERTESLIVHGSSARSIRAPGYEIGIERAAYDGFCAALAARWGTPETLSVPLFAPSQVGDEAFLRWWMRFERQSSTPQNMLAILALDADIDVREVLSVIRVPTLVVHARQDRAFPVELGRYLAAHIPNATLVEYDGETLLFFVGVNEQMDAIERFITGTVHRPPTGCSPRWCSPTSAARPSEQPPSATATGSHCLTGTTRRCATCSPATAASRCAPPVTGCLRPSTVPPALSAAHRK